MQYIYAEIPLEHVGTFFPSTANRIKIRNKIIIKRSDKILYQICGCVLF